MADQKDTYGYESKTTGGYAHAENLVIVGLDCDVEDRPELYDAQRIKFLPNEELVRSIMDNGIVQPVGIKTFRGDKNVYVADGRQRVRAARIANERRGKGAKEILVPCYVVSDAVTTFIAANRGRKQNSLMADILTAAHLRSIGHDDTAIAQMYTIGRSTLANLWWPLADASPAIRKAVEAGKITATVGAEIAKLPVPEQSAALERAIESGRNGATLETVRAARKASRNGGAPSDAPRRLSLGAQKKFAAALESAARPIVTNEDEATPEPPEEVRVGFGVMSALLLGDASALEPWPALKHAYEVATATAPVERQ